MLECQGVFPVSLRLAGNLSLYQCPNVDCDRVLYDKSETLRVIKECVDGLKKCI